MSYKELLLRQQAKNQQAQKEQEWDHEKKVLQAEITTLQNSTDIKLLEQVKQQLKELQSNLSDLQSKYDEKTELLDNTINLLGKNDIKTLTDLVNLLQGRSLQEVITANNLYQQKIQELAQNIDAWQTNFPGKKRVLDSLRELFQDE
jgi:hypothetical protein